MQSNRAVGAYGERVAAAYLAGAGFEVLERNWRGPSGEIDIIARDRDTLVFCEVKTRRTTRFGVPEEAIRPAKARRLRRLAAQWLSTADVRPLEIRFDVISVLPQLSGAARLRHLRGAF